MSRTVDELVAAARERQVVLAAAHARVAALREVGESDRGEVRAVVDGRGTLVDLWLAPGTCAGDPVRLGELVVLAATRAEANARQRRLDVLALAEGDAVAAAWERLGAPAPARAAGWDVVGDRLGDTAAATAPGPPAAAPPAPDDAADEDDVLTFDFSSLRSDRG